MQIHELNQGHVNAMSETEASALEADLVRLRSKLSEVEQWKNTRLAYHTGQYFILARIGDTWNLYGASSQYEVRDGPFTIKLLESNVVRTCGVIDVELNIEGIKLETMMKAENGQESSNTLTTCQGAPAVLVFLQVFTDRAAAEAELAESRPESFNAIAAVHPEQPIAAVSPAGTAVVDGEESPTVAIAAPTPASGASREAVPTMPAPPSSPPESAGAKVPSAPPTASGLPPVPTPPPSRSKPPSA